MININQTSENSKIYIQRNITNDEPVINNYVTEDELQEILKEYNSIPYIVVDVFSHSSFKITKGDWDAVHNAIQNNKPYLIYARSSNTGTIFSLVDDIIPHPQGGATIATTLISANKYVTYRAWIIDIDGNVELGLEEKYTIQPKLVSGENIKTINGNDILGEGDIVIESGTPYLLIKYEYPDNVIYGDFDGVVEAIENNKPYLIYTPYLDYANTYIVPTTVTYNKNNHTITANSFIHSEVDRIQKLYYTISPNNVTSGNDILFVQPKLVSGENIKTINGNSILGEGDITIEGGNGNIVELTQSEYDNITPEPDTLYVISDAPSIEIPDISNYYTKEEIDETIGDIETILDNIIR